MSSAAPTSSETYTPFIESSATASPQELQARMKEKGYLFFRDLVDHEAILELRRQILQLCAEAGWLDPSRDVMDGVVRSGMEPLAEGQPEYMETYRRVIHLPRFKAFAEQPGLQSIARKLLGDNIFIHKRHIGRITFPSYVYAPTPPHQDYYYIRGAVETFTAWVPLGAVDKELGGLAVWAGSHKRGYMNHDSVNLKAVVATGVDVPEGEADWHTADFNLGDALFFHSHTVHKALPNLTANLLRLSTDNRYQRADDEIEPGSLQPHAPRRG